MNATVNTKQIVPDSTVSMQDMKDYGDWMYPVRAKAASRFYKMGLPVYRLYPNSAELVQPDLPPGNFFSDVLYGIDIVTWKTFLSGFSRQVQIVLMGSSDCGNAGIRITLNAKPDMNDDAILKAIQAASLEYCLTEEGRQIYKCNGDTFTYDDFDVYVSNDICLHHGILKTDFEFYSIYQIFNTQLVSETDVYESPT